MGRKGSAFNVSSSASRVSLGEAEHATMATPNVIANTKVGEAATAHATVLATVRELAITHLISRADIPRSRIFGHRREADFCRHLEYESI